MQSGSERGVIIFTPLSFPDCKIEFNPGKFDFDHHFAFLTVFLKRYNFLLGGSALARREDNFQKKLSLASDFVKLVSEILYLFLAEKMVVCLFCLFILFVAILCPIWLTFF